MEPSKSNHLVLGMGQIGHALFKVLKDKYTVYGYDHKDQLDPMSELAESIGFDVLHVTFPYSEKFVSEVERYKRMFGKEGTLVIIHSTVKVGTTDKIFNAVYSPVRGIHPNLEQGIRTFTKFFGGLRAKEAAEIFENLGIETHISDSKSVEAMKLWDTTVYGVNIALMRKIHAFCEENGLNFDTVYTKSCETYNSGYEELGHPEYKKYILAFVPGKIGGHCVVQNLALLNNEEITKFISNS